MLFCHSTEQAKVSGTKSTERLGLVISKWMWKKVKGMLLALTARANSHAYLPK